jgi:hypothetical protein
MFKKAEEYAQDMAMYYESAHGSIPSQFEKYLRKAVEYGYNKANEWHFVKDGVFPEEGETVFCFYRGYCGVFSCATARLYIGYDDKVRRWWTNAGEGKSEQLMDVIAWKEIVFPKEN